MVRSFFYSVTFSVFIYFSLGCAAAKENPQFVSSQKHENPDVVGTAYRERYPLHSARQKLVGNTGDGFAKLYGARNFRAVLNGVYYRGGANNAYLRPKARSNKNPLPPEGLRNLCEEGFTRAVYLYPTNYSNADHQVHCRTYDGTENTLQYLQISPLSFRPDDQRALLNMILSHIRDPRLGPIYDHSWNGWHASGFVGAITLRQFCGFSSNEAVAYWNENTDGANVGSGYERIRAQIRAFQPLPHLVLSPEEKTVLCPKPGSLEF